MEQLTYYPKDELEKIAVEVIEYLRPKNLPVWQVQEVAKNVIRLVEWEKLK